MGFYRPDTWLWRAPPVKIIDRRAPKPAPLPEHPMWYALIALAELHIAPWWAVSLAAISEVYAAKTGRPAKEGFMRGLLVRLAKQGLVKTEVFEYFHQAAGKRLRQGKNTAAERKTWRDEPWWKGLGYRGRNRYEDEEPRSFGTDPHARVACYMLTERGRAEAERMSEKLAAIPDLDAKRTG